MGFIHFKWPQIELNYVIPSRSSIEHFEDPILDSNPSCKLQRCFYSSHIESFCLVFTSVVVVGLLSHFGIILTYISAKNKRRDCHPFNAPVYIPLA